MPFPISALKYSTVTSSTNSVSPFISEEQFLYPILDTNWRLNKIPSKQWILEIILLSTYLHISHSPKMIKKAEANIFQTLIVLFIYNKSYLLDMLYNKRISFLLYLQGRKRGQGGQEQLRNPKKLKYRERKVGLS